MTKECGNIVLLFPSIAYIQIARETVITAIGPYAGLGYSCGSAEYSLIKKKIKFLIYDNSEWSSCKVIYEYVEGLPNI
jgi:hypothetical protein